MSLKPFAERKFEGSAKIQDGARFTYWNPANGPTSYQIVDNPVSTIESYRYDFSIQSELLPGFLTTFNTVAYQLHTISDPNEDKRAYKQSTYTNSYGFGDAVVSVFVGGINNTECKLNPGEETYIKIVFYNNAGFDWNMYDNAIKFDYRGNKSLSGMDMFYSIVRAIRAPQEYNFMTLNIPEAIKDYITIKPSDHNLEVSPQVFDFQNINVVSIKDGFEGDYYYKLKIHNDFPEKYKGRLIEIGVELVNSMFDKLPRYHDPTGIHDYSLKIPPIKFGVKYPSSSPYYGKVFYTLGRVSNLKVHYSLNKALTIEDIRFITQEELDCLRIAASDKENYDTKILEVWNKLNKTSLPYEISPIEDSVYNIISVDVSGTFVTFPKEILGEPDITEFSIISKAKAEQLDYGYKPLLTNAKVTFNSIPRNKAKYIRITSPFNRYASIKGAYVALSFDKAVVIQDENNNYVRADNQEIYSTDTGVLQLKVTAKNVGSDVAFKVSFHLEIDSGFEIIEELIEKNYTLSSLDENTNKLIVSTGQDISTGEKYSLTLYIKYFPLKGARRRLEEETKKIIIKYIGVELQQKQNNEETKVIQKLSDIFTIKYKVAAKPSVTLKIEQIGSFNKPQFQLFAFVDDINTQSNFQFAFYRKKQTEIGFVEIQSISNISQMIDVPFTEEEVKTLSDYSIDYRVELYQSNIFISSTESTVKEIKPNNSSDINPVEDDKFPLWGIILLSILSISLLSLVGYLLYKYIIHKKLTTSEIIHREIQLTEEKPHSFPNTERSNTPVIKGEVINVNKGVSSPYSKTIVETKEN